MLRKIVIGIAILLLCLSMSGCFVLSCGSPNNNSKPLPEGIEGTESVEEFTSGQGTKEDPYVIEKPEHWLNVSKYLDAYFVVEEDLNLSKYEELNPIGTATKPFKGNIDGKGHSISGAKISGTYYVGLFGVVQAATIKNITLSNSVINYGYAWKETCFYGTFVGQAKASSLIENCHCTNVTANYASGYGDDDIIVGGFAGAITALSTVNYCSTNSTFIKSGTTGAFCYASIIGFVENSTVDTVWATGICKLSPPSGAFYYENRKIGGLFFKLTNAQITNAWSDVEFIDNISDMFTASLVYTIDNEHLLSCCVGFSRFAKEPYSKFVKCSIATNSTSNKYFSQAQGYNLNEVNNHILDGSAYDDMWVEGSMHPVFASYQTFLQLRGKA